MCSIFKRPWAVQESEEIYKFVVFSIKPAMCCCVDKTGVNYPSIGLHRVKAQLAAISLVHFKLSLIASMVWCQSDDLW